MARPKKTVKADDEEVLLPVSRAEKLAAARSFVDEDGDEPEDGEDGKPLRGTHTFLGVVRENGNYRLVEILVDLDASEVVEEIEHEPANKEIVQADWRIKSVKLVWDKLDK